MVKQPETLRALLVASREYTDREQVKAGRTLVLFLEGETDDVLAANDALYRLGCLYALNWSKFTEVAPAAVSVNELVPLVEVEPEEELSFD